MNKHLPIKRSNDGRTFLNIGCGKFFHSDWTNVDLVSSDPLVIEFDIRKGLPFADNSFDVVYHSHIVEHLDREQVISFLENCFRITKPGGIQ